MKRCSLMLPILFMLTMTLSAQGPFTATMDSSTLLIGARMHVSLDLRETSDFEPVHLNIPGLDSLQPVELIGDPGWRYDNGSWKGDVQLTVFDTGYFLLPAFVIEGNKKGSTLQYQSRRLALQVYGVPVDSTGVLPIKPIIEEPLRWSDFKWLLVIPGVLLLVAVLVWFFRKIRSGEQEAVPYVPPKEAHILALDQLEKLEKEALWQNDRVKEYYVRLGDIFREYLENRFEFPALEMTTGELSEQVRTREELSRFHEKTKEFLTVADMVKFAKSRPDQHLHEQWFDWVKELVLSTKKETVDPDDQKMKET